MKTAQIRRDYWKRLSSQLDWPISLARRAQALREGILQLSYALCKILLDFHRNLVRHEAKKIASRQGRSRKNTGGIPSAGLRGLKPAHLGCLPEATAWERLENRIEWNVLR